MTIIPNDEHETFADFIDWIEREFIVDSLRKNGGNIRQARILLKIPRSSMVVKMKRLGIDAQDYKPKPTCDKCDPFNIDGHPELVGGGDSVKKPLICNVCGSIHDSSGGLMDTEEDKTSDPGSLEQQGRRADGSKKQPFGTPGDPRVVP